MDWIIWWTESCCELGYVVTEFRDGLNRAVDRVMWWTGSCGGLVLRHCQGRSLLPCCVAFTYQIQNLTAALDGILLSLKVLVLASINEDPFFGTGSNLPVAFCISAMHFAANLNPFPNKPCVFMRLQYNTSESTVGKAEMLVTSNFSFFPKCFLPGWRTFCNFHQISNGRLQSLSVWESLKFAVWERVNVRKNMTMGECNTILSAYTKYRHLGLCCTHSSIRNTDK